MGQSMTRRNVLKSISAAIGLLALKVNPFRMAKPGEYRTRQSGNWSDPNTWEGGQVPVDFSRITICGGHTLTLDTSREVMASSGYRLRTGTINSS